MSGNLMELVNGCPKVELLGEPVVKAENAEELEDLGFVLLAEKIRAKLSLREKIARLAERKTIKIPEAEINRYLKMLAEKYNAAHELGSNPDGEETVWNAYSNIFGLSGNEEMLHARTRHALSMDPKKIGGYTWLETPLKEYDRLPPEPVLRVLEKVKAQNLFDYYTIATVTAVKDPLLLGRLDGSTDRYFIYQWGDDICLDDLI